MIFHTMLRAIALLLMLAFSLPAHAEKFGLGLQLGEPSGFVVRYPLGSKNSLHGGLAFSFNDFFLIYGDYTFDFHRSPPKGMEGGLTPYLGVGGMALIATSSTSRRQANFGASDSLGFGVRVPLGVQWNLHSAPVGIFVELAPGLGVIPGTFGFLQGGIGAAYYF